MSGETCCGDSVSWLFWYDIPSNLLRLWVNGDEFWNGFFCKLLADVLTKWCMNPALLKYTVPQKRCKFQTYSRIMVLWIIGDDVYSHIVRLQENDVEFWNGVFTKFLPRALCKWFMMSGSLIYTPPQKKCNLQGPAFLLVKSVLQHRSINVY